MNCLCYSPSFSAISLNSILKVTLTLSFLTELLWPKLVCVHVILVKKIKSSLFMSNMPENFKRAVCWFEYLCVSRNGLLYRPEFAHQT